MAALLEDRDLQGLRQRFQLQAEELLREAGEAVAEEEKKKQKPLPRLNTHSVFWILAAVLLTYYVDFFQVLQLHLHEGWYDGRYISVVFLGIAIVLRSSVLMQLITSTNTPYVCELFFCFLYAVIVRFCIFC
ncbi:hypothetical protein GDO78_011644 [Eleutherodactylus coqui]|uniref:Uncharacterized protein n=1 Tax=Eleutherodactylus coqui TaxID=57060 RepID=A0A8J6K4Q7_ELECQ|nr:hypothetical protein GDO78_011644 [Eleutherodactylus coqui]